jgi:SAM-dependent methyltransferase
MGPEELRRQAQLEDGHFWYAARRRQVQRRLPAPTRAGARALDLGAGSGGNTSLLQRAGYASVALEHHPVAASFARSRGLSVVRGDAQRLPFPDGTFDLVLACDVLEHLRDDDGAVQELRRVLQPAGSLVITVPADPALWSPHDVALQHFRRYTRETLTSLMTDNGFEVRSMSAWMVLLRPVVAVRRALTRRRAAEATDPDDLVSDLEPVAAPVNWALGLVLRVEHRLPRLGGRRRGVSLIAVAAPASR